MYKGQEVWRVVQRGAFSVLEHSEVVKIVNGWITVARCGHELKYRVGRFPYFSDAETAIAEYILKECLPDKIREARGVIDSYGEYRFTSGKIHADSRRQVRRWWWPW